MYVPCHRGLSNNQLAFLKVGVFDMNTALRTLYVVHGHGLLSWRLDRAGGGYFGFGLRGQTAVAGVG